MLACVSLRWRSPRKSTDGLPGSSSVGGGRPLLGAEALKAGRGFDQGPVHTEVLVRQQPLLVDRPHHLVEQGPARIVRQQPLQVLGEDRGIEAALSIRSMSKNQR